MPVYEYECPACKKVFEVQQRMSDDPIKTCKDCGGEVKKLVSVSSFHLKGGGWYSDGYSSKSTDSSKSTNDTTKKTKPAKETATPPCKGGEGGSCKNCPASS